MLKNPKRAETASQILKAFSTHLEQAPSSSPLLLAALAAAKTPPRQIVVAGDPNADDTRALLRTARRHARPNQVILLADGKDGQAFLGKHAAFYQTLTPVEGKAAAYFCEDFTCRLPTTDPETLKDTLATPAGAR